MTYSAYDIIALVDTMLEQGVDKETVENVVIYSMVNIEDIKEEDVERYVRVNYTDDYDKQVLLDLFDVLWLNRNLH